MFSTESVSNWLAEENSYQSPVPGALDAQVSQGHPRSLDAVGSGEDVAVGDQSAPTGVPPSAIPEVLKRDL